MSNSPGRVTVQAPSASEAIEVGKGATRYDWSIAFSRVCLRKKYSPTALALVLRVPEFLPRGQGHCSPGRATLANEIGKSERQVDRAFKELERWLPRKRGGRYDAATITLTIPPEDADIHHFGAKKVDAIRDIQVSRMNGCHTGHNQPPAVRHVAALKRSNRMASLSRSGRSLARFGRCIAPPWSTAREIPRKKLRSRSLQAMFTAARGTSKGGAR
jgi:hypothetical protein